MSQPYLSLEAELHDAFWAEEDDNSEVGLMASFLESHPGPALEMGAGSGRLIAPLLRMGFEIEGVELSEDMIALGARRSAEEGVSLHIHAGDMDTWTDGRKFASVLAPAFTLQLSSDPEQTLRHWHSLLEDAGALYLTVFMPYVELLGDLPENEWYHDHDAELPDGRFGVLETRHTLDRERQIVTREHRYSITGDESLTHHSTQNVRWFEHSQMLELLDRCGFQTERFFPDFDPSRKVDDPDSIDFDGILTYHAVRKP